jgi:hypothetical protein
MKLVRTEVTQRSGREKLTSFQLPPPLVVTCTCPSSLPAQTTCPSRTETSIVVRVPDTWPWLPPPGPPVRSGLIGVQVVLFTLR